MKCVYRRIARKLKEGDVKLRPVLFSEWPLISEGLAKNNERVFPPGSSPSHFSLWWRFKRLYMLSYAITRNEEIIGFAGLFDIRLHGSARLTFLLFDEKRRGHGYGSAAFRLLARSLKKSCFVKELEVRVDPENEAALRFWQRLGFEIISRQKEAVKLRLSIF